VSIVVSFLLAEAMDRRDRLIGAARRRRCPVLGPARAVPAMAVGVRVGTAVPTR